ncbi:MAG TPA: CcmD family protein [Cyclobacteriaceae bacterium]|nr:CcmD family protein [Cyclobacteriaceae bacterium]
MIPALILFLITALTYQQQQPEMADVMRSNGKIYVVVGVILIVLIGLFIYLFLIEKKVKKLEQKIEDNR